MNIITFQASLLFLMFDSLANNLTLNDCEEYKDADKVIRCLLRQNVTLLSFPSLKCPAGTCFDERQKACNSHACQHHRNVSDYPEPIPQKNINVWLRPVEETPVVGRILETIKPPKLHRTAHQARPSRCSNSTDSKSHHNFSDTRFGFEKQASTSNWKPSSTLYNCTAKRFNCTGPGLFSAPQDNTIFFKCRWSTRKNKWRGMCFTCNDKWKKCFSDKRQSCIPCEEIGTPKELHAELISEKSSYDCFGYVAFPCSQLGSGLHEHPGDRSIAVYCSNITIQEGEWMGGCKTCSKRRKSCFVEGIGQCVENCTDAKAYDCGNYRIDPMQPCQKIGKYAMPLDTTKYYECVEDKGCNQLFPECKACNKKWHFDKIKRECIYVDTE